MTDQDWSTLSLAAGAVLAAVFLLLSLRAGRQRRIIDNTPTCKTSGVFIGLVEVKGTAEASDPLSSYLAETPCVHYHWTVTEDWSKLVTETYRDAKGNTRTRTRRVSGSETIASGGQQIPFYLKDDCGCVLVRPAGAKIEPQEVFSHTCGRGDPLYFGKCDRPEVAHSDHRRHFREVAVPLHAELYVLGQARERQDVVAPEIAHDENAAMFLISMRSEQQVSGGLNMQYWMLGVLAIVLAAGGLMLHDHLLNLMPQGRWPMLILAGGMVVIAWMIGWTWMVYNSMMDLAQRVAQAWSNVDVQLKRRAELIPNLVEIVKGLRDYERTVQSELALLRAQAHATAPGVAGPDPQACGRAIVAIAERYPELTANRAFLDLQKHLSQTEQRIALARAYFNEIVAFYNTRLQIVPDRFICAMGGLRPRQYIAAEDFERAAVEVELREETRMTKSE